MKWLKIKSFDETEIHCNVFDDVENPKAVVYMSHGMAEHSAALGYENFAKKLNEAGFIAFGDDHRAHGLTEKDDTRGHHTGDIFNDTVGDQIVIIDYLLFRYKLPVIYFGHSYGSFLGQAILQHDTGISGVMLMGSTATNHLSSKLQYYVTAPLQWYKKDMRLAILGKLTDKIARKKFKDEDGFGVWLTRDESKRNLADTDKLIGVPVSISFCRSMLKGESEIAKSDNLNLIKKDIPIGIFAGSMDMVGNYGKGAKNLYRRYKNLGVKRVEFFEYEGARHNLLNEINCDEVIGDLIKFAESCVSEK